MATQGQDKLVVVDGMPAVTKLWNGRFRLEFFCKPSDKNEGWYSDNIAKWLPEFGTLQGADFTGEGWATLDGEEYANMCLVETEVPYIPPSESHLVKLVYETLTAAWVEEKDEDIDYELNGLKRVTRTFVALPETAYAKVVGTDTIDSDGTTLSLGSFSIKKTDAKWELTETWLEAGELSRSDNFEDGKESVTITQIGGCASAPAGYTVVSEKKDNTQGFETCTRTFYKDDSELSRSNDYVGSQLAEMIEVFNPTTEPTPTNVTAVLGSKSQSNVDGIPTTRYTFLVPSILSQSEDKVGSQLAITIEAFDETPATPSGYVVANKQTSDVEGIPTVRYTFLKDNVQLSESSDKVGSQLAITQEWFNPTAEPAIFGYVVANTQESDIGGIPTTRYTFLAPSILSQSKDYVGSQLGIVIESFSEVPVAPSGYSLASEQVSDFEGIKTTRYSYLKDGVIMSESRSSESDGVFKVTTIFFKTAGATIGPIIAKKTDDVEGIPTISITTLQDVHGNSIVHGGENLVNQVSGLSPFTYPGVFDVLTGGSVSTGYASATVQVLLTKAPAQCKVKTTTYFIFQEASSAVASDFTYANSSGLWSPNHWGSVQISASGSPGLSLFNDSSTFRGYRTSDTTVGPGSITATSANLSWQGKYVISGESSISYVLDIDQGPPDPIGNTYTLDVQINPAFDDIDGNQYYKKTIVVTDVIPAQPTTASLPYT